MLLCNHCCKEISFETALLTQDLNATTIAFCSDACQEVCLDDLFARDERNALRTEEHNAV
jgi:hypothetical protein